MYEETLVPLLKKFGIKENNTDTDIIKAGTQYAYWLVNNDSIPAIGRGKRKIHGGQHGIQVSVSISLVFQKCIR